jgi:hypothetical protein
MKKFEDSIYLNPLELEPEMTIYNYFQTNLSGAAVYRTIVYLVSAGAIRERNRSRRVVDRGFQ